MAKQKPLPQFTHRGETYHLSWPLHSSGEPWDGGRTLRRRILQVFEDAIDASAGKKKARKAEAGWHALGVVLGPEGALMFIPRSELDGKYNAWTGPLHLGPFATVKDIVDAVDTSL